MTKKQKPMNREHQRQVGESMKGCLMQSDIAFSGGKNLLRR